MRIVLHVRQETVRAREHGSHSREEGKVNATDLDILEGWVGEVEIRAQKLAAEISKLRTFMEKVKKSEAAGTHTASDESSARKESAR
jgi:hypothetical protein